MVCVEHQRDNPGDVGCGHRSPAPRQIPGVIAVGGTQSGTVDLGGLPVLTGDRLVLVACVDRDGVTPEATPLLTALTGYISAGLSIA